MIARMKCLLHDEEGATMVEYALILALIAMVCIAVVTVLGPGAIQIGRAMGLIQ